MYIPVNNHIYLSPFRPGDEPALVANFGNEAIQERLLPLPQPYTLQHAETWVADNLAYFRKTGEHLNWVIRNNDGQLIGSIGKKVFTEACFKHSAEIGYWLAQDHWGKGIGTACVKAYSQHLLQNENYHRLTAIPCQGNVASIRVLEKSGYQLEGILNKFVLKNGAYFNCLLYAYLKQ
ncbi:GNAT family N-acetyltransferase [bacterium]|nr:GNAT family N-acetyltransferase [bacterium]